MTASDQPLRIGALAYDGIDQIDLTGPFEVLSRLPNATYTIYAKTCLPVRDVNGLILTPNAALADAPPLDVLHIPGGPGVDRLFDDAETLDWVRRQAAGARLVFSVCTGSLLCGAAGLLKGRAATTHWASLHLLRFFGAITRSARVVIDGTFVSAAGVTAGIDGALRVASILYSDRVAQRIQLEIQYAPEPPFDAGSPATATADVLADARETFREIIAQRERAVLRVVGQGSDGRSHVSEGSPSV